MTLMRRAINSVLKAHEGDRVPLTTGNRFGSFGGMFGRSSASQVAQMELYGSVSWLYAVVSRIAQSVAASEWELSTLGRDGNLDVISTHPLLDLWEQPNEFMTGFEFRETFMQHLDLTGHTFWLKVPGVAGGMPELWPLRPDRVTPVPDAKTFLKGYIYKIGSEEIALRTNDIIWTKSPSPLDLYGAASPVGALFMDLDSEQLAARWSRNFYANSAQPGGVIEFEDTLSDDEFEQKRLRWESSHKGVNNAHRVAILEKAKWVSTSQSQRDMQFEQIRKLNRDTILGSFGFPAAMLGIMENSNRANAEEAERMFGRWVIKPRLRRIQEAINKDLARLVDPALKFTFVDPTPEDKAFTLQEASVGFKERILTLNEARAKLGFPEIEGGDEIAEPAPSPFTLNMPSSFPEKTKALTRQDDPTSIDTAESGESSMLRLWTRILNAELEALIAFIDGLPDTGTRAVTKLSPSDLDAHDWNWWAKYENEVVESLTDAILAGMEFGAVLDPTQGQANRIAVEFARTRGASLLAVDGDLGLVRHTRNRVNSVVAQTLESGDSLNTLKKRLREDFAFSPERAETVARTEALTAQGEGRLQGGKLRNDNQKRWFDQRDELVTPECLANSAQGWIGIDEEFVSGHQRNPVHPRCRCRIITRFRDPDEGRAVDPVDEYRREYLKALTGHTDTVMKALIAEARCGPCNKLLDRDVPVGHKMWCSRCKETRYAE